MKRDDFAFSSMRVRMAEKKLLTPAIYVRLAEAKDFDEALRILREVCFLSDRCTPLAVSRFVAPVCAHK